MLHLHRSNEANHRWWWYLYYNMLVMTEGVLLSLWVGTWHQCLCMLSVVVLCSGHGVLPVCGVSWSTKLIRSWSVYLKQEKKNSSQLIELFWILSTCAVHSALMFHYCTVGNFRMYYFLNELAQSRQTKIIRNRSDTDKSKACCASWILGSTCVGSHFLGLVVNHGCAGTLRV